MSMHDRPLGNDAAEKQNEELYQMVDTDVLIVGAGPTGLLLACELILNGIKAVVLDSSPGPNEEPRANGVGGLAVRLLDHRGLYADLTGLPEPPVRMPMSMFSAMRFDLSDIPSSQFYLAPVQQPRLTATLARRASTGGADLRWSRRLTALTQHDDHVSVEVDGPDGVNQITTRYLVGADGGRSATRKFARIDFPGMSSNDAVFRIGRGFGPPREWLDPATGGLNVPGYGHVTPMTFLRAGSGMFLWGQVERLSMLGTLELAPTPDDTRGGSEHPGFGDPLTVEELEASIVRVLGAPVTMTPAEDQEPLLRRFSGINSRIAAHYRCGRVLLAGDAAHVHSPLGGPGLNLCLQDAANLGWKLAAVLDGRADPTLLDTYDTERRLAAERVILHSRAQFALLRPGPEITALREVFSELLGESAVARHLADTMSGATVRYPSEPGDHPAVGYWVPDMAIDTHEGGVRRIAELARDGRPLLLDFTTGGLQQAVSDSAHLTTVTGTPVEPVGFTVRRTRDHRRSHQHGLEPRRRDMAVANPKRLTPPIQCGIELILRGG